MKFSVEIDKIRFAIVYNGGEQLGNCYTQTNHLIYSVDNVDDTKYDDVYSEERKSFNRRKHLLDFLPKANAGCELGKFKPVEGTNLFVAEYWYRTDSSD